MDYCDKVERGFSLIRVYRFQSASQNTATAEVLMSQLKWPIETIYSGMRPKFNITPAVLNGLTVASGDIAQWRDWHRMTRVLTNQCEETSMASSLLPTGNADPTALTITAAAGADANGGIRQTSQIHQTFCYYTTFVKTLTTISILAHGIQIYAPFNAEFFTDYTPWQYGG